MLPGERHLEHGAYDAAIRCQPYRYPPGRYRHIASGSAEIGGMSEPLAWDEVAALLHRAADERVSRGLPLTPG